LFSYFLGYLDIKEAHALLDQRLHEVNDDPNSRFCTLKKRFREHFKLLQKEKEFDPETIQRMIDILGIHGNYEEALTQARAGNTKGPSSGLSRLWSKVVDTLPPLPFISDKPSKKTTLNGYKLDQEDDTTFLTELCTIITEKPVYRERVEEIRLEATKSLGIKLKKLEKELIDLVRKQVVRIVKQGVEERIKTEKRDADQAAKARLRPLIRSALDDEADHPTNW
jgi:hypothetical protein